MILPWLVNDVAAAVKFMQDLTIGLAGIDSALLHDGLPFQANRMLEIRFAPFVQQENVHGNMGRTQSGIRFYA